MRGATVCVETRKPASKISIHAPHARSDASGTHQILERIISIHAPHARSDAAHLRQSSRKADFNPRSSCEERRDSCLQKASILNFNPRSSCEERQKFMVCSIVAELISIHAPHARSDACRCYHDTIYNISIHAPHARSDFRGLIDKSAPDLFQSTLLMRGATRRSAWESQLVQISIHAPHARSDAVRCAGLENIGHFNPRSSCEERPLVFEHDPLYYAISIHAPHARSDYIIEVKVKARNVKFQSTLLMRGATAGLFCKSLPCVRFQSTLLMRGATCLRARDVDAECISIHAPHARSDCVNFRH